MLTRLITEFRQTCRALVSRPEWATGVSLVLVIGLSCTGSMFAIVDPLLWKPMPYPSPDRLVLLKLNLVPLSTTEHPADWPTFNEWVARKDLFEEVAAYTELDRIRLSTPEGTVAASVRRVTPNLLRLLGVSVDDSAAWQPEPIGVPQPFAVTSKWANYHPGLVNAIVPDDQGGRARILTLHPDTFVFPNARIRSRPDGMIPFLCGDLAWRQGGSTGTVTGLARLRPGVSAASVQGALSPRLAEFGLRLLVEPLASHMTGGLKALAIGALAAGVLVLVVCVANVMNLLVARGIYRVPEFATRAALGAARVDLVRLVILELGVLVGIAISAGVLVSHATLALVGRSIPDQYAALGAPTVDIRAIAVMVLLGIGTAIACWFPAWFSARSPYVKATVGRDRGDRMKWLRLVLAASQTGFAMVMVVGATLLARSYANLWRQDTGYDPAAIVATVSHGPSFEDGALVAKVDELTRAFRTIPGVRSVAASIGTGSLLDGYSSIGGERLRVGSLTWLLVSTQVAPTYFEVVGTRMLAGRPFRESDRGRQVTIVNQAFALRFWPGWAPESVVGQTLVMNDSPYEVVGVVQNVFDRSLAEPPVPRYFQLLGNVYTYAPSGRVNYAFRIDGIAPPQEAIRRAVRATDTQAVVESVDSVDGRLAEGIRDRTFATLVLGLFGVAGLGVTASGIFAIVAFVVARRTQEIGIRVALGARAHQVRWLVLQDALVASMVGATIGFIVARMLGKFLASYLYGIEASDWTTPLAAAAVMAIVTGVAAWWPTRRALRLQPTLALRVE